MKRAMFAAAGVALVLAFAGCDSAGDDGKDGPGTQPPPSIITGFYVVLEAPEGAVVTYTVSEFNEHGNPTGTLAPVEVKFESAGARVVDLYEAGEDPRGVSVTVKMTSGSGTVKVDLWKDSALQSSAETARAHYEVCVRGGTCRG